jgi:hypothetical protein
MKKEFPKELEERLDKVVRDFVSIMDESLDILYGDALTAEDCDEFMDLTVTMYMGLLEKAIDELV